MCLPVCAAHRSEMSLGDLPAVILDVVVACAGEEHGWRLEVVSSSLQATSMECAAVRLGKCRWMGGDRTEFGPSWRHVAVALRRCPYYLLRPGGYGHTHIRFRYPRATTTLDARIRYSASFVQRGQADKFAIQPSTSDGEAIVHDHPSVIYNSTSRDRAPSRYMMNLICSPYSNGLAMMWNGQTEASTPWLLHLGSHASHLPFRRCRKSDGSIIRVLRAWNDRVGVVCQVPNWELAPATLADDERFEWRV